MGQARCARVISDVLPLPPIPYHGVDLLFIRTVGCRAGQCSREGTRCIVEHCMAWRRRARQSVACHSMALHCVVKYGITKHCNAKHGIARRRRTQHRTACHGMALGSLDGKWIVFERSGSVLSRGSMSSSLGSPKSSPQGGADGTLPLALLSTSPSPSRKGATA